ncbi:tetratricopeptide repeat protein [Kitasatospora sp. MAP5-34]|uniref:tetratricopeptide repeat protein n=1 Tax=Kitasatospora sp. MAP5-34 TaxID=3035102 RepID=UPI00247448C2|nr:tetratricopeptide repeat protein [Kitasatospora sp. MAP5-34]MDH6580807.1 hypothetical protein [Kitasatospora sp. MAP5-34]
MWSTWAAHHPTGPSDAPDARRAAKGHIDPFANRLGRQLDLYKSVLTDRERVLGNNHPDTLTTRNTLADAYRAAGDPAHAIDL